ncbi:MAG: DegT/DnrJ/EryC1/StrS family aminotransferase [Deltaproteobacteria bacterium]|nr:DegT/DnrJ/EryC1/StrS family aminotransferase [Deltaproteobacteria bacterium]
MSSPDMNEEDLKAVRDVLMSGRLALGNRVKTFEALTARYVGVGHAVAVSSGTSALHLIVRCLGIGPGDEVLVPSFTFAASVNAILYEGAMPVFVDIDPDTYNVHPECLVDRISSRTKAVMVVDVFGHPAEWDDILRVAEKHELKVIDDSCEALGSEYKGRKVGCFGDAAAFAFYPNKQITTGEGGMIVTDNADIARLARSLHNQGRGEMGAWLEHVHLGYNYRMDEMSAALGASQMSRVEEFIRKRQRVAGFYTERLSGKAWVRPPVVRPHVRMSWFVYVATLAEGINRDGVMEAMESAGIPVRNYFPPVHLQPYIRQRFGYAGGELPVTESVARRTVALPFHNNLSEVEVETVVDTLEKAVMQHSH